LQESLVKKVRVPHIPRPRATYATEFVAQGPWIQPALELDPYTKLSLMEYEVMLFSNSVYTCKNIAHDRVAN